MKALTGLPTQAYIQVGEEANIPLADLLGLVQQLESNQSPAYLARYRPDVAAGLDADRIRQIQERLRAFLDLADRRVTVLTAINQQGRLTPELREQVESALDRRELEDLYLPYKPKRRSLADEAIEQGLEALARFLWTQEPEDADVEAAAAPYVNGQPQSVRDALAGARAIVARWLGENAEIRRDLRKLMFAESEIIVEAVPARRRLSGRDEALRKRFEALHGYTARVAKTPWRQMLNIRRGAREGWLRYRVSLPENRAVHYLLGRLLRRPGSEFSLQLADSARRAYEGHIAGSLENEVRLRLDERTDNEAIAHYRRSLRKLLLAPPAGPIPTIGIETGRPGGWRAAVIGVDGEVLEAAIVRADPRDEAKSGRGDADATSSEQEPAAAEPQADIESPAPAGSASEAESKTAEEPNAQEKSGEEPAVAAEPEDRADSATQPEAATEGEAPAATAETLTPPEKPALDAKPESTEAPGQDDQPAEQGAASEPDAVQSDPSDEDDDQAAAGADQPEKERSEKKRHKQERRDDRKETPFGDLAELIAKHKVELVVLGNGPGVRQAERFVRLAVKKAGRKTQWLTVNDSGSWIYATSKAARKEMPELEPAVRSAACLARRVQNPLGELVKLDPRVLGVGDGHHEVDQRRLRGALAAAIESAVDEVGVDVNSASAELLAAAPGMTERVARRIVEHRRQHGPIPNRQALSEMNGFGARVFEQAAGYLRIYGGDNPLDSTGLHPRRYAKLQSLLEAAGMTVEQALESPAQLAEIDPAKFTDAEHPLPVLQAMLRELDPAVRNPRGKLDVPKPSAAVEPLEELKVGIKVEGVVTSVTDFGRFVDIGAEQDGLVHISQLSQAQREGPEAVKVGDRITVYVVSVVENGRRISLSTREPREPRESARQRRVAPEARRERGERGARGDRPFSDDRRPRRDDRRREPMNRTFGPDEQERRKEQEKLKDLSINQKLQLLQDRFRTKT
jgi:protein Tex